MKQVPLNYSSANLVRVRKLRREMLVTERIVWSWVRNERLGFKFRRQHPVGRYVLDFYCAEARLALEIDGPHHQDRIQEDLERDHFMHEHGILTMRVTTESLWESKVEVTELLVRIQNLCVSRARRPAFEADAPLSVPTRERGHEGD